MTDRILAPTRMTLAEFKALPETTTPTELIRGELIVSPSPRNKHQDSVFGTAKVIDQRKPDGRVVIAPMDVYLDGDNVLQPDVFWASADGMCKLGEDDYWYGAPDLVVEVISPTSAARDRGDQFDIYEASGVREYWLIDPEGRYIEVYTRVDNRFTRQGLYMPGQTFTSNVLGGASIEVNALLP